MPHVKICGKEGEQQLVPETLQTPEFGDLHWEDGCYCGTVAFGGGQPALPVLIESEIITPTDEDVFALVKFSQRMFRLLNVELEDELRRRAAVEILEACFEQQEENVSQNKIDDLVNDMSLCGVDFSEDMMLLVWRSSIYFPERTITIQIDGMLEVEDIILQD